MKKILSIICCLLALLTFSRNAHAGKWWEVVLDLVSAGAYSTGKTFVQGCQAGGTDAGYAIGDLLTFGLASCAGRKDCESFMQHLDGSTGGVFSASYETVEAIRIWAEEDDPTRFADLFTMGLYSGIEHNDWSVLMDMGDHLVTAGMYTAIECMVYDEVYDCDAQDLMMGSTVGNGFNHDIGISGNYDEKMKGCELEVTDDKMRVGASEHVVRFVGPNPCIMTSRIGVLDDKNGYQINPTDCKSKEDALKDGWNDEIYFGCKKQEELKNCRPKELLQKVADDSKLCDVGKYDDRSVQLILPQLELIGTPSLHNGEHRASSLKQFIPVSISKVNKIEMDLQNASDKWIILSDARAVFDALDKDGSCIGGYCGESNKPIELPRYKEDRVAYDMSWLKTIVEDGELLDSVSKIFFDDNYNEFGNVTILDPLVKPFANDGEFAGKVPIEVKNLELGEYAITIKGPSTLDDKKMKPRVELRGNAMINGSVGGVIKTEGHVELVIRRSVFMTDERNMQFDAGPMFDFSPDTEVKFVDSVLEVYPRSSSAFLMSSQTKIDITGGLKIKMMGESTVSPIMVRDDSGIDSAIDTLAGLQVDYMIDVSDIEPMAPVKFVKPGSEGEMLFECTSDTIEQCANDIDADELMVVREGDSAKSYRVEVDMAVNLKDVFPLHLYAASGDSAGTRILLPAHLQQKADESEEDNAEDDESDDLEEEEEEMPKPQDRDEVNFGFQGEEEESGECPSGEYWSLNFRACVPTSNKTNNDDGVQEKLSGGDSDDEVNSGYEFTTPTESNIDEPIFNRNGASGGGCSMIAHTDTDQNILLIILPFIAAILISIRRRFTAPR
ncbi:MAG: hypothetical protein HN337_01745 [Deltaproteobacteria bacterium]|nr:hypothetical protein [Deltaproteobacteria bacterium]